MKSLKQLGLTHSFFKLGQEFYQKKNPDPVVNPYLIDFNTQASKLIGLDPKESKKEEFSQYLSGNKLLPGAKPLAMNYAGHQFGVYNPHLGDGRGLLLGEVEAEAGKIMDIYLKGCGPTCYARGFDGRATLRSSIREYLGGEALHGLGIPTSRSLAILGIGELIYREFPEPAAILVRLSDSHIRFGSFECFHFSNRPDQVTILADYVISRYYPKLQNSPDKYLLFFRETLKKMAQLIASWQSIGFIHGVMNTDNMAISGVTFDYGPFGFIDHFNPDFTSNLSDASRHYALGRQPEIGYWNLTRLGETLSKLIPQKILAEELEQYQSIYNRFYKELLGRKLGLSILDSEFTALVEKMFQLLYRNPVDYTIFFRSLSNFPRKTPEFLSNSFEVSTDLEKWLEAYGRLIEREDSDPNARREKMDQINPRFILRNYLMQRAIDKALKESDFSEVGRLRILLEDPYNDRPEIFQQYKIDADFYASETPEPLIGTQLSCSA